MAMEVSGSYYGAMQRTLNGYREAQDAFYGDPAVLYVSIHAENDYPCELLCLFWLQDINLKLHIRFHRTRFRNR